MPRKRTGKETPCTACGKLKYAVESKLKRNDGIVYCSRKCHLATRWPERTAPCVCDYCGAGFDREPNQSKGRKNAFCTHVCYGRWRTENLSAENSPNWKGGKTLDYGGSNWKRQRRLARERDNDCCQDCGADAQKHEYKMDVHHIVHYELFEDKEEANKLENLVTLCRVCHTERHRQEKIAA